jgi:hypothetical protein
LKTMEQDFVKMTQTWHNNYMQGSENLEEIKNTSSVNVSGIRNSTELRRDAAFPGFALWLRGDTASSWYRLTTCCLLLALVAVMGASSIAVAQELPPGGTTLWEMEELEVVVTFLLFDPKDPGVASPKGLRFIYLREMDAPEFQDYLKKNPEHSEWAFSFVEFVRPKTWILDGKAPTLPENGAMAVWFAPVDHSQLAVEVPKERYEKVIAPSTAAVLVLGLWIPDREYAAYMRTRGHRAEYGMATLIEDGNGTFHGELRLDDLNVKTSATPQGEVTSETDPFTQVFFEPGETVEKVVVLTGRNARERDCAANWSTEGDHPLSRGVFVGPTFLNVEGPLMGSAYRLREYKKK